MMRRIISLTILLLLLTLHGVQAQDVSSDDSWYWAWKPDTGEVVAYTIDGNIHVLTTDVTAILLKPLDHQIALALLQTGDGYALYKLDSQNAIQISKQFTGSLKDAAGQPEFGIMTMHLPYVLMYPDINHFDTIWIINVEQNALEILPWSIDPDNLRCGGSCMSLSQDGTRLRYISQNPPTYAGKEIGELRERNLATGEERVFYKILARPYLTNYSVSCGADTYGENWLCNDYYDDLSNKEALDHYWLVSLDGSRHSILPDVHLDPAYWQIGLSGEEVVISPALCEQYCFVMLRPIQSTDVIQIPLKAMANTWNIIRVDEHHFLTFINGGWDAAILDDKGKVKVLGKMFCCEYVNSQSEDGHWVVVWSPDFKTDQIWDVVQQKMVYEFDPAFVTDVTYFQYGIVMDAWIDGRAWAYFFADSTGVELPHAIDGAYFEMLPDKKFLYQHDDRKRYGVENDVEPGIYRYDANTDTLTPLIPGGCLYCSWPE